MVGFDAVHASSRLGSTTTLDRRATRRLYRFKQTIPSKFESMVLATSSALESSCRTLKGSPYLKRAGARMWQLLHKERLCSVAVSTLDFEEDLSPSSDPGSNPGTTSFLPNRDIKQYPTARGVQAWPCCAPEGEPLAYRWVCWSSSSPSDPSEYQIHSSITKWVRWDCACSAAWSG